MSECRVDLLSAEEAKKAAAAAEMPEAFANLNIFRALLHRPKTARALSDLLVSLLFHGQLDARLRELVIMRIGWSTGSDYEWTQHWPIAQRFGCDAEDVLAVRDWHSHASLGETERTVLGATDELLETGTLSPTSFARCRDQLGRDASIELVAAVGTWRMVSKLTRALAIPLEDGVDSWPPDGRRPSSGD